MKRTIIKTFCIMLSLLLLIGAAPAALAVSASYTPSSQYASSVYYNNLREVQLTGNQRLDLINVALSQVGYHEGNRTADLDGSNLTGNQNYTEYGYWFGYHVVEQNSGFFYEWCAMFIAWSARQARLSKDIINNASYAHAGGNPYYFHVTYHARGSYTPKAGDLVFYDWVNTERQWDHVGIVLYTQGNYFYAVEGNASEQVLIRKASLSSCEVQGFGVPAYTSANASAVNVSSYSEPTRTLRYGNSGSDVKWLQAALLHLGYPCPIDGSFGFNTQRQLKKLQSYCGQTADGVCGPATRSAIKSLLGSGSSGAPGADPTIYPEPTRTLSKGMSGEDVKWLQTVLNKVGISVSVTGYFGTATEASVRTFQSRHGLTQDGVCGPVTRKALKAQISAPGGSGGGSGGSGSGGSGSGGSGIGYPEPTRTLKKGMSGNDVKWLQTALGKLGYSVSVTGYFGDVTHAKVKALQGRYGLTQDGIVGPATRNKIKALLSSGGSSIPYPEPTRTLKNGCTGNDVKWLQEAMTRIGYQLVTDGDFGPVTENKVKAFQKAAGLTVDGKVGPATRKAIKDRL